jgi:hypothetical protein
MSAPNTRRPIMLCRKMHPTDILSMHFLKVNEKLTLLVHFCLQYKVFILDFVPGDGVIL